MRTIFKEFREMGNIFMDGKRNFYAKNVER